jgi:hypothetical protein
LLHKGVLECQKIQTAYYGWVKNTTLILYVSLEIKTNIAIL